MITLQSALKFFLVRIGLLKTAFVIFALWLLQFISGITTDIVACYNAGARSVEAFTYITLVISLMMSMCLLIAYVCYYFDNVITVLVEGIECPK